MPLRPRELILTAIFIALAIGGGLALAQFPNVELITAIIFLSGVMLGVGFGVVVGAVAEFLYSFFNPYGLAAPPLLIAQVVSMMLVGATGGLIRNLFGQRCPPAWFFGVIGWALTFIFDLLTTLSFTIAVGSGLAGFFAAVTFGFYFYLAHQGSNILVFSLLLPVLFRHLRQLPVFNTALPIAKSLQRPLPQPSLSVPAERKS